MTEPVQKPDWFEDQLEAYIADKLDQQQLMAFESQLRANPELGEIVRFERQTQHALRQMFVSPPLRQETLDVLLRTTPAKDSNVSAATPVELPENKRGWWRVSKFQYTQLAIASSIAVLVWSVVLWQLSRNQSQLPRFAREPLVAVHKRAVTEGFQPYYICDDPNRFALTFSSRQGVPLRLAALPPGTRMLGISYLGGLSRNTTVMLGESDGKEVTVFVDRRQEDASQPRLSTESGLHIFRKELNSLVLYELTPLDHPVFLDAFEVTDPVNCELPR